MYHPLLAWKPQEAQRPGFLWAKTSLPGGENGVEVKWKAPYNASNANSFGFNLQGLMILRARSGVGVLGEDCWVAVVSVGLVVRFSGFSPS